MADLATFLRDVVVLQGAEGGSGAACVGVRAQGILWIYLSPHLVEVEA